MPDRCVYLAKSGGSKTKRTHFGIFVPNECCNRPSLQEDRLPGPTPGTIIHVVGEPLMMGYAVQVKRNFNGADTGTLQSLILLGHVDDESIWEPASSEYVEESHTRSTIEKVAGGIPPPPRGQNIRAPVDGVNTRRCQEWTMEYLRALVDRGLIDKAAVDIAQAERDAPTFGIFGFKNGQ